MTSHHEIVVRTGSRLHFGLWAWGAEHARQFGGVGMMVDQPEVVVRLTPASQFSTTGPAADRLQKVAERCRDRWELRDLPGCQIEAVGLPRQHTGLGVGTQLSLAVARGLAARLGREVLSAEALAQASGRGRRSAVGTHGFLHGGLIVDAGKQSAHALGELACRVEVPADWRVVLLTPRDMQGKAGASEQAAFASLPPVPLTTTALLERLALEEMVPAVERNDFDCFSAAVYEYGHRAGLCFSPVQHGAYATPQTARMVELLRNHGIQGVGQSSWGPTVFAFSPSADKAKELVEWIENDANAANLDIVIAKPQNTGATLCTT